MPRAKKTVEPEVSQAAAPEQTKRKRATTAKSAPAAVSHKHASKKGGPAAEPVSDHTERRATHEEIAKLAYSYWEGRGFQGGSPEEDWLRAEHELLVLSQNR